MLDSTEDVGLENMLFKVDSNPTATPAHYLSEMITALQLGSKMLLLSSYLNGSPLHSQNSL